MPTVETVVIGAGHAGLAVSRLLTQTGHEHVVLDRGRVGERWRTERWESLRLLTPNWMTRLPGCGYGGPEPDGYMSAARFVRHLERYAASFGAPVVGGTTVEHLGTGRGGREARRYVVRADTGTWRARHVVVATGPHGAPRVPSGIAAPASVEVVTANRYRRPDQLPPGGVLVVGASSSGLQIAEELDCAGRSVVLAVGRHARLPRRYRGMDVFWWLHRAGWLAQTIDEMPDPRAARRGPSAQLVGRASPELAAQDLDLACLHARGVRLVGRLERVEGGVAWFRQDLRDTMTRAEAGLHRFLDRVDAYVEELRLGSAAHPPGARPLHFEPPYAPDRLDLRRAGIGTILLATGYRPDYPWLRLPITGADGTIRQNRGATPAPGVYVVGQRFQHRRDSALIDGARHNARTVVADLLGHDVGMLACERSEPVTWFGRPRDAAPRRGRPQPQRLLRTWRDGRPASPRTGREASA
jgi:putative flavoprotein involved in K+ transport